jgi:hypothetical protein
VDEYGRRDPSGVAVSGKKPCMPKSQGKSNPSIPAALRSGQSIENEEIRRLSENSE